MQATHQAATDRSSDLIDRAETQAASETSAQDKNTGFQARQCRTTMGHQVLEGCPLQAMKQSPQLKQEEYLTAHLWLAVLSWTFHHQPTIIQKIFLPNGIKTCVGQFLFT